MKSKEMLAKEYADLIDRSEDGLVEQCFIAGFEAGTPKWKIIEEYRNKVYTKFHFNGITGDFTKKNKFLGLYLFKKGFNA